jgi:hypothetical protein
MVEDLYSVIGSGDQGYSGEKVEKEYTQIEQRLRKLHMELGRNRVVILDKQQNEVWELGFKKEDFLKKWEEYILKTNPDILTLYMRRMELKDQISHIYSDNETCFIFHKKTKRKTLQKMTNVEISEYLSTEEFGDVAKVILNSKISGQQFEKFTKMDYEDNFGILANTGRAAILEEIVKKLSRGLSEKDQLFLYGKNEKNLFNCGWSLSRPININLPNLDYNEEIVNVVLGQKNVIFETSNGKYFVGVNRLKSERFCKENGFMWHADLHPSRHRAMICSQRFHIENELGAKDKAKEVESKYDEVEINIHDQPEMEEILDKMTSVEFGDQDQGIRFQYKKTHGDFYSKKRKAKKEKQKKRKKDVEFDIKGAPVKFKGKKSRKKKSELRVEKKKTYEWRLLGSLTDSLYGFSKEKNIDQKLKQLLIPRIKQIIPLRSKFVIISNGDYHSNITETTRKCGDEALIMKYILENKRVNCGNLHLYLRDSQGMLEKVKLPKYLTLDHEEYHIECIKVKGKESTVWIDRHGVFDDTSFLY